MTRFRLPWAVAFALLLHAADGATTGSKLFRSYVSPADGVSRAYTVYTPKGYDGVTKLPAVLFLHGRGGSAASFQYPQYLDAADANGTVLLFWQGRFGADGLLSSYYVDGANGVPDETDVIACLDDAEAHLAIDASRVHLVGFSQGGKGALLVGLKNPDRFASIVDGAAPTDAFEGQRWSPTFPDFRDAAGGDPGAGGAVLARWYAQSARFYLAAARNVPILLAHGTLDAVVPNSAALFPYMNTHHVADVSGFADENGAAPTLAELHALDPAGYAYVARYPAGVGHDELGVLDPAAVFAFIAERSVPPRPQRVAGVAYEPTEHGFYWARLSRATPADGRPAPFAASLDPAANGVAVAGATGAREAPPLVTIDLTRAALDTSRTVGVAASGALALRILGAPADARLTRDGAPVAGTARDGGALLVPLADYGTAAALALSPGDVAESDLLVPALVEAAGANGARFSTELTLTNLGTAGAALEALLLDGSSRSATIELAPRATRSLTSAALFERLGASGGVAPLRLRVTSGNAALVFGASRVFNTAPGGGTYGLSFPVATAGASVIGAGAEALFFGGSPARPERVNLSLFAPFERADGVVTIVGGDGAALRALPFTLARLERVQLDDLLASAPAGTTARVAVTSGRVQAYATVVSSSATNDPFRSPPLTLASASRRWTVPAVAAAAGRAGARFTSDLYVSAPAGAPGAEMTLTFLPHGGGAFEVRLTLGSGETRLVSDLLGSLFAARVPDYGALTIAAAAPVRAFAVTRADSATGGSSQDLACVADGREVTGTAPAVLVGLAETARDRTNVTLVNLGSETSATLTLLAEDGERGSITVPLAPGEFRQLDSVVSLFPGGSAASSALVVTPAAGGRLVASGARIDNATNDPTGLASIPATTAAE